MTTKNWTADNLSSQENKTILITGTSFSEKIDTKAVFNFDVETRYYYNELLKERVTKPIKAIQCFGVNFYKSSLFSKKWLLLLIFNGINKTNCC